MTRWRDRLIRRLTGRRDYLDGMRDGALCGWALPRDGMPVPITLQAGKTCMFETVANQARGDLSDAGLGNCAFAIPIDDLLRHRIRTLGGRVTVLRGDGPKPVQIGEIRLDPGQTDLPDNPLITGINILMSPPGPAPARALRLTPDQTPLFATPDTYPTYLRHRYRLPPKTDMTLWALAVYQGLRTGTAVPIHRDTLTWLNAPANADSPITNATHLIISHLGRAQGSDTDTILWWCLTQAPAMGLADALIPDSYAQHMRTPRADGLSPYQHHLAQKLSLTTKTARDREALTLTALIRAAEHPHTLRFLPQNEIDRALTLDAQGNTPLGRFLSDQTGHPHTLTRHDYHSVLRGRGYDPDRQTFTTRTAEGHRLHAARLPSPALHGLKRVDVQVIGPVTKASGLGQATRASVQALNTTGLSVQVVNFPLDNPAPDLDFPCLEPIAAKPAHLSLIHLNAETLPLLPAYAPDITSGSHKAGYLFWELTKPAACHALALTLLDEIWTASDYGAAIYRDSFTGPITAMGLAQDVPPHIDKTAARRTLLKHIKARNRDFLCIATFDSFSFVQRKNPLTLIRAFKAAFPNGGAHLALKTQNRTRVTDPAQQAIWARIDTEIARDPRFTLIDATLPHDTVLTLTAGADAYLSLHRSEGWGFGMIEAMAVGTPVMATGYSGNLAYCSDDTAWLVPATEIVPEPQDYIFTSAGGLWGDPDPDVAARTLRHMAMSPDACDLKAANARATVAQRFSRAAVGQRYLDRITPILTAAHRPAA